MSFGVAGGAIGSAVIGGLMSGDGDEESSKTEAINIEEHETAAKWLDISDEAVDKIVADILGSEQGIADIFSKENVAGLYDTTVAAQASGDLVANLAGEIAKLRAVQRETRDLTREQIGVTEGEKSTDDGLFNIEGAAGAFGLYKSISSL